MSDISSGSDPLKEVVEQMKREAFAAGWRAAIEAVTGSIAGLERPEGVDENGPPSIIRPGVRAESGSMPTVGTTPWYVLQAVQKKQGMTGAQVIEAVRAEGHGAAEPQIRTALSRLEKREILANRHKKWFLK